MHSAGSACSATNRAASIARHSAVALATESSTSAESENATAVLHAVAA